MTGDFLSGGVLDVAYQTDPRLLGRIRSSIDTDIDHDSSLLEPFALDQLGMASRDNEDVCCLDLKEKEQISLENFMKILYSVGDMGN